MNNNKQIAFSYYYQQMLASLGLLLLNLDVRTEVRISF